MGFPSFLRVSTGSWLSIAVWVMHMSKQMINTFTRAFTFRVRASMGFTCLTPMWVWLVLAGLMSSTSHLVCVFSHILWKQTVNHSTFFSSAWAFYPEYLTGLMLEMRFKDVCLHFFLSPSPKKDFLRMSEQAIQAFQFMLVDMDGGIT